MKPFQKQLTVQAIIAGVAVVLFAVFFLLLRANIQHQGDIIESLKERRVTLSSASENLSLLLKDWDQAKLYRDDVNNLVPDKDSLVALSRDFQSLASSRDVSLTFSFGKEQNPSGAGSLGSIEFTSTLTGSANNVLAFLEAVEQEYYSMRIDNLDFSRNTGSGGDTKVFMKGIIFFIL